MPNDIIANEAQYKKLARKVAEGSIVTDALARLIEQIIAEVHDSRIEPQAARIAELEAEVARQKTAVALALEGVEAVRAALAAPDTGAPSLSKCQHPSYEITALGARCHRCGAWATHLAGGGLAWGAAPDTGGADG